MLSARSGELGSAFVCALALLLGCAAETPNDGDTGAGSGSGGACLAPGCAPILGSGGAAALPAGGGGGVFAPSGMGGSGSVNTNTGGVGAPAGAQSVPCDVAQAISTHCTKCHGNMLSFGAPVPLMQLSDFHAMGKLDTTHRVYEIAKTRINSTDTNAKMPPVSITTRPTAGELTILNDWLSQGAIGSANGCPITQGSFDGPGTTMDGGTIMPPPGTHMGGASIEPIEYNDPLMTCYQFLTHANGDASQPFSVGTSPDMYTNFTFKAPWTGLQYARSFEVVTGNMEVIHHWLFFKNTGPQIDLGVSAGSGAHPDGILLHGWAPGASPMYMDPDVGQEMPDDVGYTLETHHNNTTGSRAPDSSGVEVCVTPTVPEHIATISWVGTDSIVGTSASGTCAPTSNEEIHLFAAQPHMHLKGSHMKVVLNHAAGGSEVVHDEDFSFDYQRYYVFDFLMKPGDTLDTTCTYSSPATFGTATTSEMCYFFTLAWPALALTSPSLVGSAIHGPNTCL